MATQKQSSINVPNDATKFYRGDGTWAVPAGGGGSFAYVATPPTQPEGTGTKNDVSYDTNYLYICVATDQWRRIPLDPNWIPPQGLMTEAGDNLLKEDGDKIIKEQA